MTLHIKSFVTVCSIKTNDLEIVHERSRLLDDLNRSFFSIVLKKRIFKISLNGPSRLSIARFFSKQHYFSRQILFVHINDAHL